MWILKGVFLSAFLFVLGTFIYLYFTVYRHLEPHTSVDLRSLFLNPLWWAMGAVCFVLGLAIARMAASVA